MTFAESAVPSILINELPEICAKRRLGDAGIFALLRDQKNEKTADTETNSDCRDVGSGPLFISSDDRKDRSNQPSDSARNLQYYFCFRTTGITLNFTEDVAQSNRRGYR